MSSKVYYIETEEKRFDITVHKGIKQLGNSKGQREFPVTIKDKRTNETHNLKFYGSRDKAKKEAKKFTEKLMA